MADIVAQHIERYTDQYMEGIFKSAQQKLHRGAGCPTLFVFIGDQANAYQERLQHYCDKYYANRSGIAYLSIGLAPKSEGEGQYTLNLPESIKDENAVLCREKIREYLSSSDFEDIFYEKSMQLLDYFMEYSDLYREGGVIHIFTIFCASDEQSVGIRRIEKLLEQNLAHIYAPTFTGFCIYDDIDARRQKLSLSYCTFCETEKEITEHQLILLGSKKLNALFDRPKDIRENHIHLIVLTAFLKSGCENTPGFLKNGRLYSLGISNLKILERYVALITLSNLYDRFYEQYETRCGFQSSTEQLPLQKDSSVQPIFEALESALKKTENTGSILLRQMRRALFSTAKPVNGSLTVAQAEKQLFGQSLERFLQQQWLHSFEEVRETTLSRLLEMTDELNPNMQSLIEQLTELYNTASDTMESQKNALQSALETSLNSLQLNISSNRVARELIMKNRYQGQLQYELMRLKVQILKEFLAKLKNRGKNMALRRQALSDLGYEIKRYIAGIKISEAIGNYYTDSIQNTLKLPPHFFEKHLEWVQESEDFDSLTFLDQFCDSILENDLYTSLDTADAISDSVIGELLFDMEKKSSPYCFSLQIGVQASTNKYFIGAKESGILKRFAALSASSVIANHNFTDSISMIQVFEIRNLQTVNFVAACKQAYEAQEKTKTSDVGKNTGA